MKEIKNYKEVWNVTGGMYIPIWRDFSIRASFIFVGSFILMELFMILLGKYIPIIRGNVAVQFGVVPFVFSYVMDKKAFDEKRPYSFLKDAFCYFFRKKKLYGGDCIGFWKWKWKRECLTVIRDGTEFENRDVDGERL